MKWYMVCPGEVAWYIVLPGGHDIVYDKAWRAMAWYVEMLM